MQNERRFYIVSERMKETDCQIGKILQSEMVIEY